MYRIQLQDSETIWVVLKSAKVIKITLSIWSQHWDPFATVLNQPCKFRLERTIIYPDILHELLQKSLTSSSIWNLCLRSSIRACWVHLSQYYKINHRSMFGRTNSYWYTGSYQQAPAQKILTSSKTLTSSSIWNLKLRYSIHASLVKMEPVKT